MKTMIAIALLVALGACGEIEDARQRMNRIDAAIARAFECGRKIGEYHNDVADGRKPMTDHRDIARACQYLSF
jgi:hypothetical protein